MSSVLYSSAVVQLSSTTSKEELLTHTLMWNSQLNFSVFIEVSGMLEFYRAYTLREVAIITKKLVTYKFSENSLCIGQGYTW